MLKDISSMAVIYGLKIFVEKVKSLLVSELEIR